MVVGTPIRFARRPGNAGERVKFPSLADKVAQRRLQMGLAEDVAGAY